MSTSISVGVSFTLGGTARNRRWSYFSEAERAAYRNTVVKPLQAKLDALHSGDTTKPIYVKFVTDKRRGGSVGVIRKMTMVVSPPRRYYENEEVTYSDIEVGFDDHKSVIKISNTDAIEWLQDYEGPTKYLFDKEKVEKKVIPDVVDKLGVEVKPGVFISFVEKNYRGLTVHFGNVTRINHNGTVWATNMRLQDGDCQDEIRIADSKTIVVMTRDLMDRLTIKKMSVL
jgi:hypothetical protein